MKQIKVNPGRPRWADLMKNAPTTSMDEMKYCPVVTDTPASRTFSLKDLADMSRYITDAAIKMKADLDAELRDKMATHIMSSATLARQEYPNERIDLLVKDDEYRLVLWRTNTVIARAELSRVHDEVSLYLWSMWEPKHG